MNLEIINIVSRLIIALLVAAGAAIFVITFFEELQKFLKNKRGDNDHWY